jgi:hypothetical protein
MKGGCNRKTFAGKSKSIQQTRQTFIAVGFSRRIKNKEQHLTQKEQNASYIYPSETLF